jgi:uncharacterized protein (DUF305 family)
MKLRILLLMVAGVLLLAAGCGDDDTSDGAAGQPAASSAKGEGNGTDLAFARTMVPHHEGAIEMARLAQGRAERPEIRRLAASIVKSQRTELGVLAHYADELEALGVKMGDMGMSAAEMGMDHDAEALAGARPFDRAFIDMMIPHHEGAVRMAQHVLDEGEHKGLRKLAGDIITAQEREIEQMRGWRKAWFGGAATGGDHGGHGAGHGS